MALNDEPLRFDTPGLTWDDPRLRWDSPLPASPINMTTNRVSADLTTQAVADITAAMATIRTKLPFLVPLTPEERHDLVKVGDKSMAAVKLGAIFAAQHPEALPGTFDAAEFAKDNALLDALTPVVALVEQLAEDIEDTRLALCNDLMVAFLDLYAIAKANNRDGRYDAFLQSVSGRFARAPRPKTTPTTPPTA